jgi:hypothetical protein
MYGFLLESVIKCIKAEFGPSIWKKINEELNLDNSILANETYPDEVFKEVTF